MRIGEVRSISSLQWQECYKGVGEVKLVCAATQNNQRILQKGFLLQNSERTHLLAQIQAREINDDMRSGKMTVRAKMTACRLDERVLMHTANIGLAEADALQMVRNNLRGLPIKVASAEGMTERYDGQISWGSVLAAIGKVSDRTDLGYRVTVNQTLQETFAFYKGVDRTIPTSSEYVGFFGDTAGNVSNIKLLEDTSGSRNVAIVAGEGKGAARKTVEVDLSEGQPRRELYVNASDLSSKYTTENPDGSTTEHIMTPEEYTQQLRVRGLQELTGALDGRTLDAELIQSMMLLGKDYELGDILPLHLTRYGITAAVRIAKITLVYEKTRSVKAKLEVIAK